MKEKEAILQVAMGCLKLAHIDYEQSHLRCVWKSEKSQKTSVNWYAHGARYYDPQLALWYSFDPLSELYTSFSPYHFVGNNPVNFVDPNGMSYGPSPDERDKIKEGGHWSGLGSGVRRLQPDPYSWNNVGRFMSDPGPGAPITVDGETYTPYQDPVTGMYYYDKEHSAYTEPYFSNENVRGYSHKYDGPGGWTPENYQKAGVAYNAAYTERIYFDPNAPNFDWIRTGFDHTGDLAFGVGVLNQGRRVLEVEFVRQAKFNKSLAGLKNADVVSSMKVISKTGKVLGITGTVATYGVAGYELATGTDNTSTWIDVGITTGVVVVGIISAPVAIGAGIVYGATRLFWGNRLDGWIDNKWGYR